MTLSLSNKEGRVRFNAARLDESHLQRLRPLRITQERHAGLERFAFPAIRELKGTPFALTSDEERFVYDLLGSASRQGLRKHNLWVFRVHQQKFAGDFVIVDLSSPMRQQAHHLLPWWDVYVVDLKMNAPLKLGGGGAGIQLRFAQEAALVALFLCARRQGACGDTPPRAWLRALAPRQVWEITGSRQELLRFFQHLPLLRRQLTLAKGDLRAVESFHHQGPS